MFFDHNYDHTFRAEQEHAHRVRMGYESGFALIGRPVTPLGRLRRRLTALGAGLRFLVSPSRAGSKGVASVSPASGRVGRPDPAASSG